MPFEIDPDRLVESRAAAQKAKQRHAQWARAADRLDPEAWPAIVPKFTLERGAKVFTIGSCFARNIEEHIARLGYDVPTSRFTAPMGEHDQRPNSVLNKYTPPSIFQEIDWAIRIFRRDRTVREADCAAFGYDLGDGRILDNNLASPEPVSAERFMERRRQIYALAEHAFTADCVVITPGVLEGWYDTERGIFVHQSPAGNRDLARRFGRRIGFYLLNHRESLAFLRQTIRAIRSVNKCRFLLTTSPVPILRTFTDDDVITANTYAKCTLRAVCGDLAMRHADVAYFPSFESVMLTRSWDVFEDDRMHVADAFVGRIVGRLAEHYFTGAGHAERCFQQSCVLAQGDAKEEALALARRAHAERPGHPPYMAHLGRLLVNRGEALEALPILQEAVRLDPNDAEGWMSLARAQEATGRPDQALEATDMAMAHAQHRVPIHEEAAGLYARLGRTADAVRVLDAAIAIAPRRFSLHELRMAVRDAAGRHEESAAHAQAAIGLFPRQALPHLWLGDALCAMQDPASAERQYRIALQLDPGCAPARHALARMGNA